MTSDPRIDAYIAEAEPFARPILTYLRQLVHFACPEAVETLKWSAPTFTVDGKILCLIASFKSHCALNFWGKPMQEILAADGNKAEGGMGNFGRITAVSELPARAKLIAYLKQAAALHKAGVPARPAAKTRKPALPEPVELSTALQQKSHAAAARTWAAFPPGKRRDYIEWITEAKREETRAKRLTTALEWLAEGKARNWKYKSC